MKFLQNTNERYTSAKDARSVHKDLGSSNTSKSVIDKIELPPSCPKNPFHQNSKVLNTKEIAGDRPMNMIPHKRAITKLADAIIETNNAYN